MQRLKYMEFQKIDMDLTNKLLEYINLHEDIEDIIYRLESIFPYIYDDNSRENINIWLSTDYTDKDGKTFIEKFIQENSSLSPIEKKILETKIDSYISLFQVLGYNEGHMIIEDTLNGGEYKLWAPQLANSIENGEFILTRLGNILGYNIFVGNINYLPSSIKPVFLEELLIDFNNMRRIEPKLTMKKYLKEFSLNVYRIYNKTIFDLVDTEDDIYTYLFSELEEFEAYLTHRESSIKIKTHLSNLINIFEYTLSPRDLTLYDLDILDFESFFKETIDKNFICSQKELNSYIDTLKKYLKFLSNMDINYRDTYSRILDISKDRFYYMSKLKNSSIFKIERDFLSAISYKLNNMSLATVRDYDKFIIYANENYLDLTTKNRHIKRKDLLKINELLEFKMESNKKSPNQKDFPLIHFFYYFSLDSGILEIKDNILVLTDKGLMFLRLSEEEKYILLFNYLWSENFMKDVLGIDNVKYQNSIKKTFTKLGAKLKPDTKYNIANILNKNHHNIFLYYKILRYLGIIEYSLYLNPLISFTILGNSVFEYLNRESSDSNTPNIIPLDDYRNTR